MPNIDSNNMGPLATKLSPGKSSTCKSDGIEEGVYYAVYIPLDLLGGYDNEFSECDRVFNNKEKALLFIKKNKKIRFKSFRNLRDAQNFAYNGGSNLNSSFIDPVSSGIPTMGHDALSSPTTSSLVSAEKPSPFRSLKSQELVKLRKLIEKGNLVEVKKLVWENPRYLVSSGDFPTILHEGCRYNALHVSTKALNPAMTELLLEIIGNPDFTNLLYDTNAQSNHSYIERSEILLDLYLNTPDKALNETPLHFASKFGSAECVGKLISCAKTQTQVKNKEGKTPLEVACSRCPKATDEVKSYIRNLLSEAQFFVPIWSSNDACEMPLVGAPCKSNMTPSKMSIKRNENDVTSPTLEIKAFAGPMSETSAKAFRNKWKREMKQADVLSSPQLTSPLRTPSKLNNSSLNYSSFQSPPTSVEKSFEIVGRRLALENRLEWRENWPFLNKCVDLQSSPGLEMLESYLHNKLVETLSSQKDTSYETEPVHMKDEAEPSCNNLCINNNSSCVISPIEKLCLNFDTLSLSSHSTKSELSNSSSSSVSNMSHLLIEKSCEVFAKRLLQGLKNASFDRNRGALVRILRQEAKHLNNLCSSFTQDIRFQGVSLNRIHSMIAKCLLSLLMNSCPPECMDWILNTFSEISKSKLLNCYSLESDNTSAGSDKSLDDEEDNASVFCLISQILGVLNWSKSDGTIAELSEDSNDNNNTDDIIHRQHFLGLRSSSTTEDQGSYNNNHWNSGNSKKLSPSLNGSGNLIEHSQFSGISTEHSNKISGSVNDSKLSLNANISSKVFGCLNENSKSGSLHENGAQYIYNSRYSNEQSSERKALVDLSNAVACQSAERTNDKGNDFLSKSEDVFLKPSDSLSKYKELFKDVAYISSSSEKEAERKWNQSATCLCTTRHVPPRNIFSNIRSYSRFGNYRANAWTSKGKRIDFDMEDPAPMRGRSVAMNESTGSASNEKSIAETQYNLSYSSASSSDSSDTDDEYFTPPGSYTTEQVLMSSSEEEMMDAADEDVEVFLVGNALSSTDVDVYHTLTQCPSIDNVKYPNIYKWRHLVQLKLQREMNLILVSPAAASGTGPRNLNRFTPHSLPSPRVLFSPTTLPRGNYIPLQSSTPSADKS